MSPASTRPARVLPPRSRASAPKRLLPEECARIEASFACFQSILPEPRPELDSLNPYTFLVAVALSAQATDKSVNKATERLFPVADTPAKMLALGAEGLEPYIKSIGLYRSKAKNVIAAARILVERYSRASGARPPAWF